MKWACCGLVLSAASVAAWAVEPTTQPAALTKSKSDDARYLQHLRKMLDEGTQVGKSHLQAAQRQFEAAQRLRGESDPRLQYGYGLVLLRQFQFPAAAEQFAAAAKHPNTPFLPAWRALVWSSLNAKQQDEALKRLADFARFLNDAPAEVADKAAKGDAALWIGQVVEALRKTADSPAQVETIAKLDLLLQDLLGDDLLTEYEQGQWFVQGRYAQLSQDLERLRRQTANQQQVGKQAQQERIALDREGVQQKKETLARTADDWKKWLDEQTADFDKQLGQLEKDYNHLDGRAKSLAQSSLLAAREITLLRLRTNIGQKSSPRQLALDQLIGQRELQIVRYQTDQTANTQQMNLIRQKALQVLDQRAAAVRRYELATGQIVKQNESLKKWNDRLKKEAQRVAESPVGKSTKLSTLESRLRAFGTYVELDLETEKERLLASFAAP